MKYLLVLLIAENVTFESSTVARSSCLHTYITIGVETIFERLNIIGVFYPYLKIFPCFPSSYPLNNPSSLSINC